MGDYTGRMELRGIDVHVHPCDARIARAWAGEPADYERFFRGPVLDESGDAMAERFRGLGLMGVLLGADAETTTGIEPYPKDRWSLEAAHATVRDELEYYARVVRENGLKGDQ